MSLRQVIMPLVVISALGLAGLARADDDDFAYQQANLVSNGAVTAKTTDMNLKNPWGIVSFPGGPFWIADNGTGLSTLYDGKGNIVPLKVTIPGPGGAPSGAAPTGIVWNGNPVAFHVGKTTSSALFIFATEDGTISAWNSSVNLTNAILEVDNSQSGAVYKGLALANNAKGVFLYATNFNAGTIDVFDSSFNPATLEGSFSDPSIPPGYAPFGIAQIDGDLFVTYALQDAQKHDDVKGAGHGFVDVFDTQGHLLLRFASRGALNSPWGVARAPYHFGPHSSEILVGNFGDGRINGFTSLGRLRGALRAANGHDIQIDGLWSIIFGTGAASDPGTLYFTAGINDEADGLFGSLSIVPVKDHDNDD
jgi:uncharacterized protein (TIGR03118 family)